MIRVFVVDDAVVVRRTIARALESTPDMELAGFAVNGRAALDKLESVRPHVVLLDLEMPELDGFATLAEIRRREPDLPVVIFSVIDMRRSESALDALAEGPTEFVLKPSAANGIGLASAFVRAELIPVIRAIARSSRTTPTRVKPPPRTPSARGRPTVSVVVVAVSTGGPDALATMIRGLSEPLVVPMLIVQHMPPGFTGLLANRLNALSDSDVVEAREGDTVRRGKVYIAPGGHHLIVARTGSRVETRLDDGPRENSCRPSADVLFRSAVQVYGPRVLAVVLTGMGQDGLRGSRAVSDAGGTVIAQSPATATVPSMPESVAPLADAVIPLDRIGREIRGMVASRAAR